LRERIGHSGVGVRCGGAKAAASAVHDRRTAPKVARPAAVIGCRNEQTKEVDMRKILRILLAPAAFAVLASAGVATTTAPAQADVVINPIFPFIHLTPPGYTYAPPAYYYAPNCHWDAYYGRVCY
jgi:hypothetical protein